MTFRFHMLANLTSCSSLHFQRYQIAVYPHQSGPSGSILNTIVGLVGLPNPKKKGALQLPSVLDLIALIFPRHSSHPAGFVHSIRPRHIRQAKDSFEIALAHCSILSNMAGSVT